MRLLLDTNTWIWMLSAEERLSAQSRTILADPDTELYLSAATVWEIAIKHAAGKVNYSGSPAVQVPIHIKRSGVRPLAITAQHALAVVNLPMHHRSPFDRIMVAQAQVEDLTLASTDDRLGAYDVPILNVAAEA